MSRATEDLKRLAERRLEGVENLEVFELLSAIYCTVCCQVTGGGNLDCPPRPIYLASARAGGPSS